jgi:hypothetical protein
MLRPRGGWEGRSSTEMALLLLVAAAATIDSRLGCTWTTNSPVGNLISDALTPPAL